MTATAPTFFASHRLAVSPFDGRFGRVWMVADAAWVTDAEVREGRTAPVVAQFDTFEEAANYCRRVEAGELRTEPHESAFLGWPALRERAQRRAA